MAMENSGSWWRRKDEGFLSIFAKLLYLILVYGLVLLLILDKTAGGGVKWIFAQYPTLKAVRGISPANVYFFWLVSLLIGFIIGKRVGLRRGASRERKRLGIPF